MKLISIFLLTLTVSLAEAQTTQTMTPRRSVEREANQQAPATGIQFTIGVTNNYVNITNPSLQIVFPYDIAISVDDTNYAVDAAWKPYTSANVVVPLGPVQGWHDVRMGLRGHTDDPTNAVWQEVRLYLDLTPLMLVITSPTPGVVGVPLVQVQGFANKDLSSLSYDISNVMGVVGGQQGLVLWRDSDTSGLGFTTNYFQCFDIELVPGTNLVSVHATDSAGHVTTTNLVLNLDFSTRTNPPMLTLTFPQDEMRVSGTSFTMDGFVDDPTAAVTGQIVDGNRNTNTVRGQVERSGRFWLDNLPLNSGTNVLTVAATDAAGNTTATNIAVVKSQVTLTINPVADTAQLWHPKLNLTGTISETNDEVWVNGVKGHNNGDGTWYANDVPTTPGGVANFTVTANSSDETRPDGSRGNRANSQTPKALNGPLKSDKPDVLMPGAAR